jgi:cytochrome c oxidase subunit 4
MAAHTTDAHEAGAHHVLPMKIYYGVFAALMVLTVITVGVSYIGLPEPFSILAAMAVAIVKAALVAGFFMHLRYDDRFLSVVFFGSVVFLALMFMFTIIDLDTRGSVYGEQGTFIKMEEDRTMREYESNPPPDVPPAAEIKLPGATP